MVWQFQNGSRASHGNGGMTNRTDLNRPPSNPVVTTTSCYLNDSTRCYSELSIKICTGHGFIRFDALTLRMRWPIVFLVRVLSSCADTGTESSNMEDNSEAVADLFPSTA